MLCTVNTSMSDIRIVPIPIVLTLILLCLLHFEAIDMETAMFLIIIISLLCAILVLTTIGIDIVSAMFSLLISLIVCVTLTFLICELFNIDYSQLWPIFG